MKKEKDLSGQKFGKLTVLHSIKTNHYGYIIWLCVCECGIKTRKTVVNFRRDKFVSCGCDFFRAASARIIKHGHTQFKKASKEYNAWAKMKSSVKNPKHRRFSFIGKRGIKFDPAWENFEKFLLDMGPAPSPSHKLVRLKSGADFSAENCAWMLTAPLSKYNHRRYLKSTKGVDQCIE